MINNEFIYQQYIRLETDAFRASLVHSLINCMSDREFFNLWNSEYYEDTDFRKIVIRNLERRVSQNSDYLISKAKDLFFNLGNVIHKEFVKHRFFISNVVAFCDKDFKLEFFQFFMNSHRSVDRKQAIKVIDEIWDDEVSKILMKKFEEHFDYEYLSILMEHNEGDELVDKIVDNHWDRNNPRYEMKMKIIQFLNKKKSDKIEKIKKEFPLLYIHFCTNEGLEIPIWEQDSLINITMNNEGVSSFLIWCLGKLKRKDLLESIIESYEIPKLEFYNGV